MNNIDLSLILPEEYSQLQFNRNIQPVALTCALLPYQKRAISWMLSRENVKDINSDGQIIYENTLDKNNGNSSIPGSLLCDEMGLGKTVMIISLILLHSKNSHSSIGNISNSEITPVGATLIIVPESILCQWISELKKHAPKLKFLIFDRGGDADFNSYDVVLTTYKLLGKEVNFTQSNPKQKNFFRHEKRYKIELSPLVKTLWWRVIVDEAQMVSSKNANATKTARVLPRVHSLAATGTPIISRGYNDIFSLLEFVEAREIVQKWTSFIRSPDELYSALRSVMHRNSKANVETELILPIQNDTAIYLKFNAIEQHYYDQLLLKCHEDFERGILADAIDYSLMRSWLLQLRQTCCHPQIGQRNQRILGSKVSSMAQVLKKLFRNSKSKVSSITRELHIARIALAQCEEFEKNFVQALKIYEHILKEVESSIESFEKDLTHEIEAKNQKHEQMIQDSEEDYEEEISVLKIRIQLWFELKHRILFFMACCYHSLDMSTEEDIFYEKAAQIRKLLLNEYELHVFHENKKQISFKLKIESEMSEIKNPKSFYLDSKPYHGGIRSNHVFNNLQIISDRLNDQWDLIIYWRKIIETFLDRPLEEKEDKMNGDEFESDRARQETLMNYLDAYQKILVDRKNILDGWSTSTVEILSKDASDLLKELYNDRIGLALPKDDSNFKNLISELREIKTNHNLPIAEFQLCDMAIKYYSKNLVAQCKVLQKLVAEEDFFSNSYNARIEYYRQLQKISDGVVAVETPVNLLENRQIRKTSLDNTSSLLASEIRKHNYMKNMMSEENRECTICSFIITKGTITPCGHFFCTECISEWTRSKSTCPLCNQKFKLSEEMSYDSSKTATATVTASSSSRKESLELLKKLSATNTNGSYGTKIDTMIKHILFLKKKDPWVKVIVFSQWEQLLDFLEIGLEKNNISMIKIGKKKSSKKLGDPVILFEQKPTITVFLLNAKTQSSGMNLISASHVFIMEPVTNGLDQQAINRVSRIGQTKETFVWRYIVESTVEEKIHMMQKSKVKLDLEWIKKDTSSDESTMHILGLDS